VSGPAWTVLACGERERGDDAAGLEAAIRLAGDLADDGDGVRIRLVGQLSPEDLVDGLDAGRVLVLDAVRGVEPGSVMEMPLSALVDRPGGWSATTHVLPIASVVRLAAALGAGLDRGWFVGLGGERFELGSGMSAPVRAALPRFVGRVERLLSSDP
jgi:hydrogenase maturation protease